MAQANPLSVRVYTEGTGTFMARLIGSDGAVLTQANISSGVYTVYQNPTSSSLGTAVTGHDGATLTIADVIFDSLQTGIEWTVDTTGYNFRHTVPIDTNDAFATRRTEYVLQYKLTPTSGQNIVFHYLITTV